MKLNSRLFIILSAVMSIAAGAAGLTQPAQAQQPKDYTPEQVVESVILIMGSRPVLAQIRRNGVERGRMSRMTPEGRSEEARYELRFIHGDKTEKDKVRIDQKTPQTEFTLINSEGRVFGIINGSPFTPRADTTADFLSQQTRSIDALLRYKENESKLASAGKDKQQGVDVYVIDLIDKANRKTRFFISAKTFRVLWLEYEETPPDQITAVKYTKRFYDYRVAQNTLVPYRTVVLEDGKQTRETRVLTVTYGVKMEEAVFKHPDAGGTGF
ncbi:MAG TPA: hypothetical protein VGW76_12450 [Pyrinomonadaceae bacterium]|nr:hypothetical protein [Pyrinomonadaceae bacterium]